jgi:type IV secretion system protein VirB4
VVLATQSLADLADSPLRPLVLESCPTRIYLPNPEALREDGRALYRRFGLSEREAEIVGSAVPKRDYYYRSPLGSRLFELGLSAEELSILAPSTPGGTHATLLARVG